MSNLQYTHLSACYPVLKDGLELHLRPDKSILIKKTDVRREGFGLKGHKSYEIENFVANYIMYCDGQQSNAAIAEKMGGEMGPLYGAMWTKEIEMQLTSLDLIELRERPLGQKHPVRITGSFTMFAPLHASYELTEHCNFRCDHCYVSASPEKYGCLELKQVIELFDKLANEGVRVIEITGGECTTYPHFIEVLEHAVSRFDFVGIITNGYALGTNKRIQQAFGKFRNKLLVQISIDGTKEYHDKFRKMPGSFDACVNALKILKQYGIIVRVSTTVTSESVYQLKELYALLKDLKVDVHVVTPMASFGRGLNNPLTSEEHHRLLHLIGEQLSEYVDDPMYRANISQDKLSNAKNCGAGSGTFAINYAGEVRSCLYLSEVLSFGNVRNSSFENVFATEKTSSFRNAPSPGGDECGGCKYISVCTGCFAKAFQISETDYPACPWRKKWFPNLKLNFPKNIDAVSSSCSSKCSTETKSNNGSLIQIKSLTH